MEIKSKQQHFMVVTYPAQGHINPGRHLAAHLARTTGARVTFSTSVSAHRRMFPSLSSPDEPFSDDLVTYIPFSDSYDDGYQRRSHDATDFVSKFKSAGSKNLAALICNLAANGNPVTCIIYTILINWVPDVARELGVPSALYWIQPATVFSLYYHYFHGYEETISSGGNDPLYTVNLPGLRPLQIRDLPSFVAATSADNPYSSVLELFRELFETLDREATLSKKKMKVLVNTFDELEPEGLNSVQEVDLVGIGPVLPSTGKTSGGDLFKPDVKNYVEWLDSKPEGSVVYISFGSLSVLKKEQIQEISKGLKESKRPYLWVIRKDNKEQEGLLMEVEDEGEDGMVVEWCSQMEVLPHRAVGCFVTHCGWNSTVESLVCGVPTVCVPQWTDQGTNAMLMESFWGKGVRAAINADGMLEAAELRRCLDVVMGEEERGKEIRMKAKMWREKAMAAMGEGGSSNKNLRLFVEEMQ